MPQEKTPSDRVRRSKETVLRVTWELLNETGLSGLSVEEVARRSGVAKTTIYRHWPSRTELILAACSEITTDREPPDTGSLRGDLAAQLAHTAELLCTARWASVLPSIIDAAERDPELARIHGLIQQGHAASVRVILERAQRTRELPPQTDTATLIASLLGPLFYRRWFSREPLDGAFLARIIDTVIGPT